MARRSLSQMVLMTVAQPFTARLHGAEFRLAGADQHDDIRTAAEDIVQHPERSFQVRRHDDEGRTHASPAVAKGSHSCRVGRVVQLPRASRLSSVVRWSQPARGDGRGIACSARGSWPLVASPTAWRRSLAWVGHDTAIEIARSLCMVTVRGG